MVMRVLFQTDNSSSSCWGKSSHAMLWFLHWSENDKNSSVIKEEMEVDEHWRLNCSELQVKLAAAAINLSWHTQDVKMGRSS